METMILYTIFSMWLSASVPDPVITERKALEIGCFQNSDLFFNAEKECERIVDDLLKGKRTTSYE